MSWGGRDEDKKDKPSLFDQYQHLLAYQLHFLFSILHKFLGPIQPNPSRTDYCAKMSSSRNFGGGFANRQRNLNAPWRQKQNAPQAPSPPLGEVLAVMFPDDIENACESDDILPRIRNVQYLASYNWLNGKTPSILIPGKRCLQ